MNIYQKAFSGATKANIKLFPLDKDGSYSFYKRRKILRQAWKLKIDVSEDHDVDDEEFDYTESVLDEPFEIDCLGCDYRKIDSYSLRLRHCNKCNNYKNIIT